MSTLMKPSFQCMFSGQSFAITQYIVDVAKEPITFAFRKQLDRSTTNMKTNRNSNADQIEPNEEDLEEVGSKERNGANKSASKSKSGHKHIESLADLPLAGHASRRIKKLYIQVDHRALMTESEVSVGPVSYIWTHFILCKLGRYSPFKACCSSSVFGGSCGTCVANCICRNCSDGPWLTWQALFRFLGMLFTMLLVPVPYGFTLWYLRIFDKGERFYVSEYLLLLVPCYYVFALFLLVVYQVSPIRFHNFITNIMQDFKSISCLQCFRPFIIHFLLPFEILGLLGLLICPVYWLITFPFLFLLALFYCIPTLYLLVRFIFYGKPGFLNGVGKCFSKIKRFLLKGNGTSKKEESEDLFALKYISPSMQEDSHINPLSINGGWTKTARRTYPWYLRLIIGLVTSALMLVLLAMFAQTFRLVIEIAILTIMGAMVNAGTSGKYFMFGFFVITYVMQVFNDVNEKYLRLSTAIFELFKKKLDKKVEQVVTLSASEQKNTAFKYFPQEEINELVDNRKKSYDLEHNSETSHDWEAEKKKYRSSCTIKNQELHWKIFHLIFFLDKNDVPRIPKALFRKIASLRLNGCPGPVYVNILSALKHLFIMMLFLFFIMIVVLSFGDESSQLAITSIGGFFPFVVNKLMKRKGKPLDLSTYAFKGEINEIISDYVEEFPMSDLALEDSGNYSREEYGKLIVYIF